MDVQTIHISKIICKPEPTAPEWKEQVSRIAKSISEQELFHPVTVRPADADGNYALASGNKRMAALKVLGRTDVPCIIRQVADGEAEEITQIHENLYRFNLPWFDQCELERRLHELRVKERGQGKQGRKVGWSLRDTAEELDMSFGVLSEDIRIAEVIEADPSLKKIGDKKTARRVILENLKRLSQEAEASQDAPIEFECNKIYHGSAEEVLKAFPQQIFHACITDPPWMHFKDDRYVSDEFTLEVFKQVFRVLTRDSFLIMFVSTDDFFMYRKELPKIGYTVQQQPNIWIKEGVLTRGKRSWEYERDYEPILVACKGTPALTSPMLSSIFSCKIVPPMKMIHPNEKPKEVIRKLINDCTFDNALILDPFGGSGVLAEVARESKRRYVVIERNADHYHKIVKRLEDNSGK